MKTDMKPDDFTHTAKFIEDLAKRQLSWPRGSFSDNYWQGLLHLAKAYQHADSVNQAMMRRVYAPMFEDFNARRPEAA